MGRKIVLQNEIDQQYNKFNVLTKNFLDLAKDMSFRLSLVSGAFKRSGGQTTIISTCRLQSRCLLDIAVTLHDGAELLRMSKETMRNLDSTIRQEINNKDIPSMGRLTFGDTTSDSIILTQEQYEQYLRENDIINRYNNGEKVDIDSRDNMYCGKVYFEFSGGCTWYAAYRFKKVTGIDLDFIDRCNAHDWDNYINRDLFNVNPTSIIENIVAPSVAVQEGGVYGHVVFIEAVRDGKVYFSESSYGNTGIAGTISCVSIEEFMSQFQSIISAK